MKRHFVIAYKRSLGRILELQEFEAQLDAFARRLVLDLRYRSDTDVEVVMFGAENRDELKKTHSRYFRSLSEIATG